MSQCASAGMTSLPCVSSGGGAAGTRGGWCAGGCERAQNDGVHKCGYLPRSRSARTPPPFDRGAKDSLKSVFGGLPVGLPVVLS
eukprot:6661554-Prymnesium_polylepis.1